jgi:tRNA G18 (ribose-2'-O)-methylase SpoU
VAEGRLVVRQLLAASRLHAQSLLVTERALEDLGEVLGDHSRFPVYVVSKSVMSDIVGFNIHRGCLGLGVRPAPISVAELIGGRPCATAVAREVRPTSLPPHHDRDPAEVASQDPRAAMVTSRRETGEAAAVSRAIVLEAVSNVDNIGGIFRCVAALGGHAVIVGPGCGDPLYRKAIRTSMGATLRVPFASASAWPDALHHLQASGFTLVGLTPERGAEPLEDVAADLRARARVALIVGAEGAGLSAAALACTNLRVRIPMAPGSDSINVAIATAIALYRIA